MIIIETKGNALDFVTASGYSSVHYCSKHSKMDIPVSSFNLTIVEYRA